MTEPTAPNDAQRQITAYWDRRGPTHDRQPGHGLRTAAERDPWLVALRALLPPAPADILDVGTGTGFLALLLAALGHRVTGVDLSEGMLAIAREQAVTLVSAPQPSFIVGDAIAPPGEPGTYDVVASRHVLWTLTDLPRALANWRRLLRPGGQVVAIDGLWWAQAPADEAAKDETTATGWQATFREYYRPEVCAALPLMAIQSLDPVVGAFHQAGFADVRVSRLDAVEQMERAANPEAAHTDRYVLTATKTDAR